VTKQRSPGRCPGCRGVSRRRFLTQAACAGLVATASGLLQFSCTPAEPKALQSESSAEQAQPKTQDSAHTLPTAEGSWTPTAGRKGKLPEGANHVRIGDIGTFTFDAAEIQAVRDDIFQPGHYAMFDVLKHLHEKGNIRLESHFDESADTYIIDAINGKAGWWYEAYYSAGWREDNVFRMDMYPYKNGTVLRLYQEREKRLDSIYRAFREEVSRLRRNGDQVILPELEIRSPAAQRIFKNVQVTPHDVRTDLLRPGTVTALDALLSLQDQSQVSNILLTWYEQIGPADPVDSYWVSRIDDDEAVGGCGFVYETGPRAFPGFSGSHIHLPSDVRVTRSPEYALWFWICLGRGR